MSRCVSRFACLAISFGLISILSYFVDAATISNKVIYATQKRLIALGYNTGPLDGLWGKKTQAAIQRFQRDQGLPTTGDLDQATKARLSFSETPVVTNNSDDQITPSETAGICLASKNLFKEYQKNENQFNERFNEIPLCVAGYPKSVGEQPDYFYIDITENKLDETKPGTDLNVQCRMETLNALHRRILKRTLEVNTNEQVRVKGIYQSTIDTLKQTLVLAQCYLIKTAEENDSR